MSGSTTKLLINLDFLTLLISWEASMWHYCWYNTSIYHPVIRVQTTIEKLLERWSNFTPLPTYRKIRHRGAVVLPLQSLLLGWSVLLLQEKQRRTRTPLQQHHAPEPTRLYEWKGQRSAKRNLSVCSKGIILIHGFHLPLTLSRPKHSVVPSRRGLLWPASGRCPPRPQQDLWQPGGHSEPERLLPPGSRDLTAGSQRSREDDHYVRGAFKV